MEQNNLDMLEFMRKAIAFVDEINAKAVSIKPADPYQSEHVNELVAAFAKAQSEYPSIGNNRVNPFFKSEYADFDSIMCVIRPIISKHGLSLVQYTKIDEPTQSRTLHTRLYHSSGQWLESRERIIPEKNDDQKWASTVTFKKRHQAMAILNVTIDKDKYDDDAEENVKESRVANLKGTATNHTYEPVEQRYETINALEHQQLTEALQGWPDFAKAILSTYKISTLADLPRARYAHVIQQVRTNVENRKRGTTPTP